MSENGALRRIFGPKNDKVTREWRKLHNEELNDLYSSPNIVRVIKSSRMSWAGHVERMGERRGVYMVLVGKPLGKRPLGRPKSRWKDNINLLTGYFLGCWCNLPWVFKFKCPLFLVSIKQEEQCKHNGGFFQYVMKT